ncbi:unnamed protein product [Owenia fusiformis]|uniref:Uncharacterized protein n=1 Tax=Owenia fusiformis TaxID=6347 RepID=A0A8J1XYD6_OWEFU|nr:unnamed protein product [Owenia fusiformis]
MVGVEMEQGALYSPVVGLIYVFNLIVGTGALTMPKALGETGWLLGLVLIIALAFMSYMTVTFVVESMASANAMIRWKHLQRMKKEGSINEAAVARHIDSPMDEQRPLLETDGSTDSAHFYDITQKIEMGQMARLFFNIWGVRLFYVVLAIYLYGDLAIYAAAVPKSLRDVACTYTLSTNQTNHSNILPENAPCWSGAELTRLNAYRIFVAAFTFLLGPFMFFNVQKTKYLQIFTTIMRWAAFLMMIIIAAIRLIKGQGQGHPPVANFTGVPNFFGVCVYSFMCHHSLPSLVTPIRNKSKLKVLFSADYILILGFYLLLSYTGIFAFSNIKDLYTLSFNTDSVISVKFIQYFLALFPVFTLSTNFPIIGITLRENIKSIFYRDGRKSRYFCIDRLVFPIVTLLPPVIVALITEDVEFLVGITGSYAGSAIQYIVPAALVYYSRRDMNLALGSEVKNTQKSPFASVFWVGFTLIWALSCISFVTVNHIITKK